MQVCDSLGVPLEVVPLTDAYWDKVVSESVSEIRAGRTPNPDMLCNSRVKFGAFYEYLQQHSSSFDRVASGHYARVVRSTGPGMGLEL
jgi:tRNA-specific 2-thiouridylase